MPYLGLTKHPDQEVVLYTGRISERAKAFKYRNMRIEHLASHASLDELVHTIQSEQPKPYEMYDLQVQANVFSFVWYKKLHNGKTPPLRIHEKAIINKHRDSDCNLKGEFLTKKNRYQVLEEKHAKGTLEVDPEHDIDEGEEMKGLIEWFQGDLPQFKVHGLFDSTADLGCTKKDKRE